MVVAGCAEMGTLTQPCDCDTGIGPGTHKGIDATAIIIVTGDGKKLKYVSPSLSKKVTEKDTDVVWKIVPPTRNAKIQLCIKENNGNNPFSNFTNTLTDNNKNVHNHCSVQASGEITGTVDMSKIPEDPGYLEFKYSVFNNDNNSSIDPDGVVYK